MLVEGFYEVGYVMLLMASFGVGIEFFATKIPTFRISLREFVVGIITSWQLGFIVSSLGTLLYHYGVIPAIIGDVLFFLGLGIALPDLPRAFKKYWKYILAVLALTQALPAWLVEFFGGIEAIRKTLEKGVEEAKKLENATQENIYSKEDNTTIEWKEPDYLGGSG